MFECQRMERRREHRAEISWVTEKGGLYGPTSPKIQRSTINRELALLRSGQNNAKEQGQVAFFENFRNDKNGWPIQSGENYSFSLKDENYDSLGSGSSESGALDARVVGGLQHLWLATI